MMELQRILCAVDFSEFSRHALLHALSVARSHRSTVTALHVVAPAPAVIGGGFYFGGENPPPLLLPTMDLQTATRELDRFVRIEPIPGVKVETLVTEAAAVHREILAQAARLHSNLLVMLFIAGVAYARVVGRHPLLVGIAMVALGSILVALTIALGG